MFYAAWFLEMFQQAKKHDWARVLEYIIFILTTKTVPKTLRDKYCEKKAKKMYMGSSPNYFPT